MGHELSLLGLAKKAGLLEIGEESVNAAAQRKKARVILSASDASDGSKRRALGIAETYGIAYLETPFTKEELAGTLGRGAPGMLAVMDFGLAASFAALMAARDPAKYGSTAELLAVKAERALRRKRETAAHRKNIRTGKRRKHI